MLGWCLVSLHFLCYILCSRSVSDAHRSNPSWQQRLVRDRSAQLNLAVCLALVAVEALPLSHGRRLPKNVGFLQDGVVVVAVGGLLVPIEVAR